MARLFLVDAWSNVATIIEDGDTPIPDDLARLRLAFVTSTRNAAEATNLAHAAGGSGAMFEENELERCWRDANAVTKTSRILDTTPAALGAAQLGLPLGPGKV